MNNNKIIINGGNPLLDTDFPKSWEAAHEWEEKTNEGIDEFCNPKWKFDCGFKLDFDGPIVSVSSRFYPPTDFYGPGWDGEIDIRVLDKTVYSEKVNCKNLDELKIAVDRIIKKIFDKIMNIDF